MCWKFDVHHCHQMILICAYTIYYIIKFMHINMATINDHKKATTFDISPIVIFGLSLRG